MWNNSGQIELCGKYAGCNVISVLPKQQVINYLLAQGGGSATVQDLLNLANDLLGGWKTAGQPGTNGIVTPGLSDVTSTLDFVNTIFEKGRWFLGYFDCAVNCSTDLFLPCYGARPSLPGNTNDAAVTAVFPNPAKNRIEVSIPASTPGSVTLVLTDMQGRVVTTRTIIVQNGKQIVSLPIVWCSKRL
jgi:hypothetical protein